MHILGPNASKWDLWSHLAGLAIEHNHKAHTSFGHHNGKKGCFIPPIARWLALDSTKNLKRQYAILPIMQETGSSDFRPYSTGDTLTANLPYRLRVKWASEDPAMPTKICILVEKFRRKRNIPTQSSHLGSPTSGLPLCDQNPSNPRTNNVSRSQMFEKRRYSYAQSCSRMV